MFLELCGLGDHPLYAMSAVAFVAVTKGKLCDCYFVTRTNWFGNTSESADF